MARRRNKQLELTPRTWGGRREHAGRRRIRDEGVAHRSRPPLSHRTPVLVTMRVCEGVPYLRDPACFRVLQRVLRAAGGRFGTRITHFSIQGNHFHLIIEAPDEHAMARAMKGLAIRVAQSMNRQLRRSGQVISERYHTRYLRTPTQAKNAVRYVLENHKKHFGFSGIDRYASLAHRDLVAAPLTWILKQAPS